MLRLLCLLGVLQLVSSLTVPNCTVRLGTTCVGYFVDNFAKGDSIQQVLVDLHDRFCGCTHVTGSIRIDLASSGGENITLTGDDFNFFYHLREVSGVFTAQNFPLVPDLTLPNLRIIRGDDLVDTVDGHFLALSVTDSEIGALYMPELREVTNGDVLFENVNRLCSYKSVNWEDILNEGELLDRNTDCNQTDLSNCTACDSGGGYHNCWSPEYCQLLSKVVCASCGLDRCYYVEGSTIQCCNPLCAASCNGSNADECYACKDFENGGRCVTQCPPEIVYNPDTFQLEANPEYRLAAGDLCVEECPEGLFELTGSCVQRCPEDFFSENGKCFACDGPCPIECDGLAEDELVDSATIEQFRLCNIVTTGGIFIGLTNDPDFDNSQLELLSTIQEIRGPLRIQGWTGVSFPYLRNLRLVGDTDNTLPITCGAPNEYSLVLALNNDLQEIDLSSLEVIRGAGIVFFNNPELCYTGDLSIYIEDSSYHQCVNDGRRKDTTTCLADGFECHEQCDSRFNCWGPNDTQCDGCLNFRCQKTCLQDCSVVVLPSNSSGLFQNEETKVCEDCDYQCLGGCIGGIGPSHCIACRNYFIQSSTGRVCVGECPSGTYLDQSLKECLPCSVACPGECAGPLPHVDLSNGCLECNRVILDSEGGQVICIQTVCTVGTYPAVLDHTVGDLPAGMDVCHPCHELCSVCSGSGITFGVECHVCKFATHSELGCVRECNGTNEYLDPVTKYCTRCANTCIGCNGPSDTECVGGCADGFCVVSDRCMECEEVADGFECHEQCDSRFNCWGPNDTQCDGCLNFRCQKTCLQDCSVVVLPSNSSGLFQNEETKVCEDCDYQCLGGCIGGIGPSHCIACRNYFIQSSTGRVCVGECPSGTYLDQSLKECLPCSVACPGECAGPLPHVDLSNGCLECNRVILDSEGGQVICIQTVCTVGTYPAVLDHTVGDLPAGMDVCHPCHELCSVCSGSGITFGVECHVCKFATHSELGCVRECNGTNEYLDPVTKYCTRCANTCIGCNGPSDTECVGGCADGFCVVSDRCMELDEPDTPEDSENEDDIWPIFAAIAGALAMLVLLLVLFICVLLLKKHKTKNSISPDDATTLTNYLGNGSENEYDTPTKVGSELFMTSDTKEECIPVHDPESTTKE